MGTHKIPEPERYKGSAKWVQYILVCGLFSLLQSLPVGLVYKLGRSIGWFSWKFMSKRRAVVRKNLEVVNAWMRAQSPNNGPESNDGEEARMATDPSGMSSAECNTPSAIRHHLSLPLESQIKEVFQRVSANFFSGLTFSHMSPKQMEDSLQIEGLEHLEAALSEGKGAIVILSHMGPWEALPHLPPFFAVRHGIQIKLGLMYRPLNNTHLDRWFKNQREASGARLFSRRDGFHKPVDFIRSGGILFILADQKMREGPLASYFGLEVATSPIPGLFHRRSGAPMLTCSFATLAPTCWKLTVSPVAFPPDLDMNSRAALASTCNRALEQGLASSPCDGLWMHKRF
jgi:KDO2-lipid IV(A) lauroyltransferase